MSNVFDTILTLLAKLTTAINPIVGGIDVNVQDQTTRPLFLPFAQEAGAPTTLTADTVIDDTVLLVTSSAGFLVGSGIGVFSGDGSGSFMFATVIAVDAGGANQLTVDSPVDHAYLAASSVLVPLTYEMAVDGSVTPTIFRIGGIADFAFDITRVLLTITTTNPVDWNGFGDAAIPLTSGLVLRRVDGLTQNYWNVKKNIGFAAVAYDVTRFEGVNPQDVDALAVRLTFAGQNKMGVTVRLDGTDDNLEMIIQDNLTVAGPYGIISFTALAEGHIVE